MKSRRQFIKTAGTGLLAAGVTSAYGAENFKLPLEKSGYSFGLGMAGYSFKEFTIEQTIDMMKRIDVKNMSIKDFHMPLNSTQGQIEAVTAKFRNAGINVYTVGVIYMKSKESADQAFEYARMAGVKMIVGTPDYELLPYVEEKVKTYGIRLAVHIHGPDSPVFPNATDAWNHIKDLDQGIGICLDIGHTTRDGHDPCSDIEKYINRIYDVHIKDVDKPTKEGTTVEMGRGIIDIPKLVSVLRKGNYSGNCSLEFEKDMNDPLAGIAESIGYWRGVMACNL